MSDRGMDERVEYGSILDGQEQFRNFTKSQNSRVRKRTELGQLLHILDLLRSSENKKISSISRYANMSHGSATRNCESLVRCGLLSFDGKRYLLTSNGFEFISRCRDFEEFLARYGLGRVMYH